jgi:type IV pilus assembly protein PilM
MAQRILAIDIGTSGVIVAEFAPLKGGGLQMNNYGMAGLDVDPLHEESRDRIVAEAIKQVLHESKIKAGPAVIAVAGQSVFSRYIKLPPVSSDRIEKVVEYEARDNVPFSMDEVVWDYQLIPNGTGEFDCLLVAIKEEIINEIATSVSEAGIEVDLVDVAPMAIFNAFKHNYEDPEGCTLVLDMGSRTTDLIFIEGGRLYNRSIPVAGNAVTQQIARELDLSFEDAEAIKLENAMVSFGGNYETPGDEVQQLVAKCTRSVMTRMHAEINRSINFYRGQQSGRSPDRILLTGGTSVVPHTDTFLHEKLGIPVDYLDPFQNVVVSRNLDLDEVSQDLHKLSEVVGLGLRQAGECPIELNLMPGEFSAAKDFKKKQPVILVSMVLILVSLLAWCFSFYQKSVHAQSELGRVETKFRQLDGDQKILRVQQQAKQGLEDKIGVINQVADQRGNWVEISDAIRGAMPASLWVYSIEPVFNTERELERGPVQPVAPPAGSVRDEPERVKLEIVAVRLIGMGYNDLAANKMGKSFRTLMDNLRAKGVFKGAPATVIKQQTPWVEPNAARRPKEYFISFEIVADLEESIQP